MTAPVPPMAPAGTKTDTVWIWLIVLLPLLSIASLFLIDVPGYVSRLVADPGSPAAILSLYTSPGYLITVFGSLALYVLVVIFANRDVAALTARQVVRPFHWGFAFLGPVVYTIGRSVVVRRRTGQGLGPLWGMIAVFVIAMIASTVWSVLLAQQILAAIPAMTP